MCVQEIYKAALNIIETWFSEEEDPQVLPS